jgi:hypothetical protein
LASCSIRTRSRRDDARRARRRARSAVFLLLRASASNLDACPSSSCGGLKPSTQQAVCQGQSQARRPSKRVPVPSRDPQQRQHDPTHNAPPNAPLTNIQRLPEGTAAARQCGLDKDCGLARGVAAVRMNAASTRGRRRGQMHVALGSGEEGLHGRLPQQTWST